MRNLIVPMLIILATQVMAGEPPERPLTKFKAVLQPCTFGLPGENGFYGEFTVKGPIEETLVPLPKDVGEVVRDSAGSLFAIGGHELYLLDLPNKKVTKLFPNGIPKLFWTMGLSYDTKRKRLLIATLDGKGALYAYDDNLGTWATLSSLNNVDLTAIAYLESLDRIFAIAAPGNIAADVKTGILYEYAAESGGFIRSRSIDLPIVGYFTDRALQLIPVDDSLVFIQMPKDSKDDKTPTIHIIDPKTGKVQRGDE
jgi:hypothetical protein